MKIRDLSAVVTRTDLWNINPRFIHIKEGWNPRTTFDIDDLKASIREHGVLMPLRVQKIGDGLLLIDGERRLRSVLALIAEGVDIRSVPAIVETSQNDVELLARALVANLGEPLSPLDEAHAFQRLVAYGLTQAQIAAKVGRSQSHISSRLTLLQATPLLLQQVTSQEISPTEAVRVIKQAEKDGVPQLEVLTARKQEGIPQKRRESGSLEKQIETITKHNPIPAIIDALYRVWTDDDWNEALVCVATWEDQRLSALLASRDQS